MEKRFLLFTLFLLMINCLNADTYVKVKTHTDSCYHSGIVHPSEEGEYEIWIGNKKMSFITTNWIRIVDLNKNQMFVVNRNDRTYIETKLPLNVVQVVPERYLKYPWRGSVKKIDKAKKIGKWNCDCYFIQSYIFRNEYKWKFPDIDSKIWVTKDVSFDLDSYHKMNMIIMKLRVYEEKFFNELEKIKGFRVFLESKRYFEGYHVKSYEKVIEISEKKPPTDVYTVPADFTKKENF